MESSLPPANLRPLGSAGVRGIVWIIKGSSWEVRGPYITTAEYDQAIGTLGRQRTTNRKFSALPCSYEIPKDTAPFAISCSSVRFCIASDDPRLNQNKPATCLHDRGKLNSFLRSHANLPAAADPSDAAIRL